MERRLVTRATPDADAADAAGLVELIDRLEKLLNESELSELEIEAGQTAFVLRKPGAVSDQSSAVQSTGAASGAMSNTEPAQSAGPSAPAIKGHAIVAPLTGLFYLSPSPGAEAYVREGGPVSVGQVIGLIEAMKLFNEIKSDVAGRVVKIHAETGALVKAKQPLIEVEP
jgi:acetyl-CoA carboxylase biotin carboxyl carrier protein